MDAACPSSCIAHSDHQQVILEDPMALGVETPTRRRSVPLLPASTFIEDDLASWHRRSQSGIERDDPPIGRRQSVDSRFSAGDVRSRRIPFELHFTPVNSSYENSRPIKPHASHPQPVRSSNSLPIATTHRMYPTRCRLIGFTPLNEDAHLPLEADSSAPQFLGPRQVKAKEAAPCALFYERADVFVSTEMKSQNVLSYCENHYKNIRFDDEVSIKEFEYVEQPEPICPLISPSYGVEVESPLEFQPEPMDAVQEGFSHLFATNGLTTMPLDAPIDDNASQFSGSGSHIANNVPWLSRMDELVDGPNLSGSSVTYSSFHSRLSDPPTSSSTRATSPVSSIYSNVSASCQHAAIPSVFLEHNYSHSEYPVSRSRSVQVKPSPSYGPTLACRRRAMGREMTVPKLSNLKLPGPPSYFCDKRHCNRRAKWDEDRGSLADDEEDGSACSSVEACSSEEEDDNQKVFGLQ